jgi:hypothetical protein
MWTEYSGSNMHLRTVLWAILGLLTRRMALNSPKVLVNKPSNKINVNYTGWVSELGDFATLFFSGSATMI